MHIVTLQKSHLASQPARPPFDSWTPVNISATIAAHRATRAGRSGWETMPMLRVFEMAFAGMITFGIAWAILKLTGRRAR